MNSGIDNPQTLNNIQLPGRKYNLLIERIPVSKLRFLEPDDNILDTKFREVRLPGYVDLRKNLPPIFDQGGVGSCTANALSSLMGYRYYTDGLAKGIKNQTFFIGSRLFL